ncbi:MAG TPA: DivIVA domain-containing protein [Candidatus Limnocylindria bacterium]|nr:DivIVA domain-containing protein [Candidatus Limnocylindria bacterium]
MAITVTMIEEKEFKTKVRGYDPLEVDEFLDAICDEIDSLNATIAQLREQLKQQQGANLYMPAPAAPMPAAPAPAPAPAPAQAAPRAPELPADLKTAKLLLEETQRACDMALAEANRRAQEIIAQAEGSLPDAETRDLEARREELQREIESLTERSEKIKQRLKTMLKDQIDIVESELP